MRQTLAFLGFTHRMKKKFLECVTPGTIESSKISLNDKFQAKFANIACQIVRQRDTQRQFHTLNCENVSVQPRVGRTLCVDW